MCHKEGHVPPKFLQSTLIQDYSALWNPNLSAKFELANLDKIGLWFLGELLGNLVRFHIRWFLILLAHLRGYVDNLLSAN